MNQPAPNRLRIALIGMGRMGKALDALAADRGCEVVARLDADDMARGLTATMLAGAQCAIDFSLPHAAVSNALSCLALGCPVVIGTTGWDAERARLEAAVHETRCPALWSPNFSVGVQLFLAVAEEAGRRARLVRGFEVHLVETHHSAKLDAPSGTAIAIGERVSGALGQDVSITSVRVGSVPGTHEVILDAPFEQIRLVHEARDRRVFADGALAAARWLSGVGAARLYTMRDMLTAGDIETTRSDTGVAHD